MADNVEAALSILSQAPEIWRGIADEVEPAAVAAGLHADASIALAHATLALVEQQKRTADALERIADRLEMEPVNDDTFHIAYVPRRRAPELHHPTVEPPRAKLDPSDVRVESFGAAPEQPRHVGGTTTPSACCDNGCTDPPC
jgi:hypothetical protein